MIKTLISLLLLAGSAFAADPLIFKTDASGTVMYNNSGKDIVALVVTIDIPAANVIVRHEHFFRTDPAISAGGTDSDPSVGPATAQFVQFSDGTTWGELEPYGSALFKMRQGVIDFLNRLQSSSSDEDFAAILNKYDDQAAAMQNSLKLMLKSDGVAAVRSGVASRLKIANDRKNTGKF